MFANRNKQAIIIALMFFQFLDKMEPIEGSTEVETYCDDLCPIEDQDQAAPTLEEIEICEKLCLIRVEVENVCRIISIRQLGNVVLSSFSIVALLNLLMFGTIGSTNMEIREAIGYSDDLTEMYIHENYKNFLSILQGVNRGVELYFHTALFFQEGISILASFEAEANSYISEIDYLDFQNSPDTAKQSINTWVSNNTEGKINEIISNALSPNTKCIGVSFITFKASWAFGFNSSLTENGIFYAETENITIPMMTTIMNTLYFRNEDLGFEIISLPFTLNSYAMYILLPIEGSDINELKSIENSLVPRILLNYTLSQMEPKYMQVTIPRMKVQLKLSLKEDLESLEVNQIFSTGADFGKLSNDSGIIIDDLFHVGFLEINEAGVNTDVVSDEYALINDGSFRVDRPFLIFIRDKDNKFIIFCARVIRPEILP